MRRREMMMMMTTRRDESYSTVIAQPVTSQPPVVSFRSLVSFSLNPKTPFPQKTEQWTVGESRQSAWEIKARNSSITGTHTHTHTNTQRKKKTTITVMLFLGDYRQAPSTSSRRFIPYPYFLSSRLYDIFPCVVNKPCLTQATKNIYRYLFSRFSSSSAFLHMRAEWISSNPRHEIKMRIKYNCAPSARNARVVTLSGQDYIF